MHIMHNRRSFLATVSLAGAASLIGARTSFGEEPPPETTTVRFEKDAAICLAPQYLVESLLRAEGFTDIRYVEVPESDDMLELSIARGDVDFDSMFSGAISLAIEAGTSLKVLAGMHGGCFELFGHEGIHSLTDLKGKSVGVIALGSTPHVFLSIMAAYVGLDPVREINWVTSPDGNPLELFANRKVDAFLGFPPEPQEIRARHIGHTIVNTVVDRPWSQYFCCMPVARAEYVERYPMATKRVLRALLKATDLCASEPERARAARLLVDQGFTERYDYALETLNAIPYDRWREYDPEDSIRFYALRLHELGMIKSSPQKIIADGTDWRFLDELKRELKG
jgi:NitT/TauT family transport system substrate-binding protein